MGSWLGLVYVLHALDPEAPLCHFKRVTGVPCPTCGLTRGVTAIVQEGDVGGGLAYNPLVMTVGAVLLAALALRLALGRTPRLDLTPRERRATWWTLGVLLALNWAYLILYVG